MQSRNLGRKFGLVPHALDSGAEIVSVRLLEAMSDGISDMCLVRECKELEELCGLKLMEKIPVGKDWWGSVMRDEEKSVNAALMPSESGYSGKGRGRSWTWRHLSWMNFLVASMHSTMRA